MRAPASSQSRTLVWAGILAGHAVLIFVMATSRTPQRLESVAEVHSLPIYLTPLIEEPPPIRRKVAPAPIIKAPSIAAESTAITTTEPQQVSAVDSPPMPQVDWGKEATKAIRNMAQSESGPATSADRPQDEAPSVKGPRGIFEKRSPREAGYIEELAPGITRRWLSEKCYQEFGHLPPLFADQRPAANPVRCIIGSSEPDGDLFDHLKPEYLKRK